MHNSIFATRIAQGSFSARGAYVPVEPTRAARLKAVREATGRTQLEFLPLLNAASARVLGDGVRVYSQSTLSKLESGIQESGFDDIAVFAAVDPKRRGKLWLIYGEVSDATMREPSASREGKEHLQHASGHNDRVFIAKGKPAPTTKKEEKKKRA